MLDLLFKVWALGYGAGAKIRWYTPILCRYFGDMRTDPTNGVRMYTYRGISLLICK